jgi:hypothetical protein
VKLTVGSAVVFVFTRTNNSEHVKGIIPLSGPSMPKLTASKEIVTEIVEHAHPIILQDNISVRANIEVGFNSPI